MSEWADKEIEKAVDPVIEPAEAVEPESTETGVFALEGLDWNNDELFYTEEIRDESSMYDPKAFWNGDYYESVNHCRVPIAFKDCPDLIDRFVEIMLFEYPDTEGFWLP